MPPDRARTWPPAGWSLRTRLVAALLALLFLLTTLVAVVTGVALRGFLLDRLDSQLAAAAQRSARGVGDQPRRFGDDRAPGPGPLPGSARGRGPAPADLLDAPGFGPGTLIAVIDGANVTAALVNDAGERRSDAVTFAALAPLATQPADDRPRTVEVVGLGDYRVVSAQGPGGSVVLTGLPLAGVSDTLLRLAVIEIAVISVGLVAAGLAGTLIVRRSLRPLLRVAATAGRVSELPLARGDVALAERVPERDTDPRTEVGQVGAALNRLLGHVARALQARQDSEMQVRRFVADASHELRTPLASIRGYAELARRGRVGPVPPDVARALERVESEATRMTSLVEDLLLLARLDTGGDEGARPLLADPVDLTALLVDAVSDAHAAGPDHHWQLDLPEEPVVVVGDATRLHQVVVNLLANARTHTPPGTHVTASLHTREAGTATLTVLDDGPGIPPALLPTVFERFARGDSSRSRQAGSTGLGLAIVSAVVAGHRGTVEVASRPGQTAFRVRLPLLDSFRPRPVAAVGAAPADSP